MVISRRMSPRAGRLARARTTNARSMNRACSTAIWFCAVVLFLLRPGLAFAQSDPTEALMQQGVDLRRQQRDADALDAFRRAYELGHSPRALAQIALAEQALGRWADAGTHLQQALQSASDPWIAQHAGVLNGVMATIDRHLGSLDIICNVPGAEVWIDGTQVGVLPLQHALRLESGAVQLEVRASGYLSAHRTVEVSHDIPARETVRLVPSDNAAAQPTAANASPSPLPSAAPSGPTSESGATHSIGIAPVALLVGGAIGLIVGGTLIVMRDAAQGNCVVSGGVLSCPTAADAMRADSAPTFNDAAIAFFAVGSVALVGGAAWLIARMMGKPEETHAFRMHAAPLARGGAVFGISGDF